MNLKTFACNIYETSIKKYNLPFIIGYIILFMKYINIVNAYVINESRIINKLNSSFIVYIIVYV